MNIEKKLSEIVQDLFNLDNSFDLSNNNIDKIPEWTSLRHIKLILIIEDKFKIKIPSQKINSTLNFQSLLSLIDSSQENN